MKKCQSGIDKSLEASKNAGLWILFESVYVAPGEIHDLFWDRLFQIRQSHQALVAFQVRHGTHPRLYA